MSFFGIFTIIIIVIGVIEVIREKPNLSFSRVNNRPDIDESLEYLRRKRPIRPRNYVMSDAFYDRYEKHFYEEDMLSEVATDILRHLGLTINSVPVFVVDDLAGNAAGMYSSDGYGSKIEIKIQRYTRPNEVLAVLIHECMHYYLRLTGLGFEDVRKNEILTDTATIYFGFYDYIYSGYIHAGYIREGDIRYIRDRINNISDSY